jgi:DNA-binding transcriptional MerR regulator
MKTPEAESPTFNTGEVARLIGVSKDAIRKAEREGRIPSARREEGGDDRVFCAKDIASLRKYFHGGRA